MRTHSIVRVGPHVLLQGIVLRSNGSWT